MMKYNQNKRDNYINYTITPRVQSGVSYTGSQISRGATYTGERARSGCYGVTNWVLANPVKITTGTGVANDVFNDSSPIPSTNFLGRILSGVKNTYEFSNDEEKKNDVKEIFKKDNGK